MQMTDSALIVVAHPDDEVLGCGGTIAKLANEGTLVHVVFLADGISSRENGTTLQFDQLKARRVAAKTACDILGVRSVSFGDFPDNRMDTVAMLDITQNIERHISANSPKTVITHHSGDVNVDHRRTLEAVITACRPQVGHPVKSILSFEVPSSTEWQFPGFAPAFQPNWFVDISSTIDRKMEALNAYAVELRSWPHPRSHRGGRVSR
jgi:N-acetylglucosamine malate deacetylase 1